MTVVNNNKNDINYKTAVNNKIIGSLTSAVVRCHSAAHLQCSGEYVGLGVYPATLVGRVEGELGEECLLIQ